MMVVIGPWVGVSVAADDAAVDQGIKRRGVIIPLHEDINPLSGELLKRKFA